jgi:hypothetical protein
MLSTTATDSPSALDPIRLTQYPASSKHACPLVPVWSSHEKKRIRDQNVEEREIGILLPSPNVPSAGPLVTSSFLLFFNQYYLHVFKSLLLVLVKEF